MTRIKLCLALFFVALLAPSIAAAQRRDVPTTRTIGRPPPPAATPAPAAMPAPVARGVVEPPLDERYRPIVDEPGYRVLRKSPIAFRPFAISDLGPGATPERSISLPNGKSVTVAAYLSQINAIERRLNEVGYSLRDMGDTPDTATPLAEPVIGRQQLNLQSSAIASGHLRRSGASPDVQRAFTDARARAQQSFAAGRAGNPTLTQALSRVAGSEPGGIEKQWGLPIGDPHSVWVSLDGEFALDGTAEGTSMELTQRARGSVLDHDLELLSMTGQLRSPVSQPMLASLEFRVMGNTVSVLNDSKSAGWSSDGRKAYPVTWADLNPLSVGGVPMQVEFNVHGEAGVQYYVAVYPGSVMGVVTPFVDVTADADIKAIDATVLEAGVAGALVVVDDRLVVAGSASLQYDNAAGKPYLYYDYLAVNDFEALQGNLNVYVCAYVISNWQPKKKCWRNYLWKEDGIDLHDTLFTGSEKVYLD